MKFNFKKHEGNTVPDDVILLWLNCAKKQFLKDKNRQIFISSEGNCTIIVQRTVEFDINDVEMKYPNPVVEFIINQNGIKSVSIPENELNTAELVF